MQPRRRSRSARLRGMEPDTGVLVMVVVPIHEAADEGPRITQGGEALGERGSVFHGLEKAL